MSLMEEREPQTERQRGREGERERGGEREMMPSGTVLTADFIPLLSCSGFGCRL